jgi:hypothetical protein
LLVAESLRFCVAAAGGLRDPSLADVVLGSLERLEQLGNEPRGPLRCALEALVPILAAGVPAGPRVRELAASSSALIREAVALGLSPRGPEEQALLVALAADPMVAVRNAANASLAAVGGVPWWTGKWNSDPAARLLPREVEAGGEALRRVSELLDRPRHELFHARKDELLPELVGRLRELPDALAIEPLEKVCTGAAPMRTGEVGPLLLHLLEREGGVEAFLRMIEAWGREDHPDLRSMDLKAVIPMAPATTRGALCRRLLAYVAETPQGTRFEARRRAAVLAASFVGMAWPVDDDITPVLDELLRLGAEEGAWESGSSAPARKLLDALASALWLEGVDPAPVLERLCDARVAGYPIPWRGFARGADVLLARAPWEVLRRTAERAIHSEDEATIEWAAGMLLDEVFDPARDGAHVDRARALVSDARIRPVMIRTDGLRDRAVATLRADLRAGRLSYPDAVETFDTIGRLYGGLALDLTNDLVRPDPALREAAYLAARTEIAPFLGPIEVQGPPTEEEWEALRRARAAFRAEHLRQSAFLWTHTLRAGGFTAEERADLETYLAAFRGGATELAGSLLRALNKKVASAPDEVPAELPGWLDEICARCAPKDRSRMKYWRGDLRKALGLPRKPAASHAEAPAQTELPGGEWNDDDDDDEDGSDDA